MDKNIEVFDTIKESYSKHLSKLQKKYEEQNLDLFEMKAEELKRYFIKQEKLKENILEHLSKYPNDENIKVILQFHLYILDNEINNYELNTLRTIMTYMREFYSDLLVACKRR